MKAGLFVSLVSLGSVLAVVGCKGGDSETTTGTNAVSSVPYSKVQAVLDSKCTGCHGNGSPKAGVDLTSFEAVMKGGRGGPIVKAADVANSELVQVMRATPGHKKMPPMGEPVSEDQIKLIESWVQSGAKSG